MSFFTVQGLSAGYRGRTVVSGVSFSAAAGGVTGVLGANGSGKTTLLKAVCGILPHSGHCTLGGQTLEGLSPRRLSRLCGYIPQRSGISIDISVLDVVLMGFNPWLGLLEYPGAAMRRAAAEALASVGLPGRGGDNYQTLSEGEKQLCILARALTSRYMFLLLDEPESSLDFQHRYQVLSILRSWANGGRRGVLIVLHDVALALEACDQIIVLREGQLIGCLLPGEDSLEKMETILCQIYGPISLARCPDRTGRPHLVMLREG